MRWIFLVNVGRLLLKAQELNISVICFTFYRSPDQQRLEFALGHSRTPDGLHPKWLAIDLALWEDVDEDGTVDKYELRWKTSHQYTQLGEYWESLGGVWGGRWKDPFDPYHFEWSKEMKIDDGWSIYPQ